MNIQGKSLELEERGRQRRERRGERGGKHSSLLAEIDPGLLSNSIEAVLLDGLESLGGEPELEEPFPRLPPNSLVLQVHILAPNRLVIRERDLVCLVRLLPGERADPSCNQINKWVSNQLKYPTFE